MPTTYRELIFQIRENLLDPHPMHPREQIVYRHLKQNSQLLFNHLLNQPPNWALESTQVDVAQDQHEYTITAENFGKDVLVETMDDSDPQHVARPIRRMSLQSSLLGGRDVYTWPSVSMTTAGEKHSAHTFVFYREPSGAIKVRVEPIPTMAASYKVWFETMEPDVSLGAFFPVAMGESLLCLQSAFDSLPGAHWPGFTKTEDSDRRKELAVTLGAAAKAHQLEYKRFAATDTKRGRIVATGFQDDSYIIDQN